MLAVTPNLSVFVTFYVSIVSKYQLPFNLAYPLRLVPKSQ